MRTMKDKERLLVVIKVFLDLHGPATATEIANYVNRCPIKLLMHIHPNSIAGIIRFAQHIEPVKGTKNPRQYQVVT